jgi:hypothetical protein
VLQFCQKKREVARNTPSQLESEAGFRLATIVTKQSIKLPLMPSRLYRAWMNLAQNDLDAIGDSWDGDEGDSLINTVTCF